MHTAYFFFFGYLAIQPFNIPKYYKVKQSSSSFVYCILKEHKLKKMSNILRIDKIQARKKETYADAVECLLIYEFSKPIITRFVRISHLKWIRTTNCVWLTSGFICQTYTTYHETFTKHVIAAILAIKSMGLFMQNWNSTQLTMWVD